MQKRSFNHITRIWALASLVSMACVALALPAHAETNTVACQLKADGSPFKLKGTCAIPCAVNQLAINIDGPRPGFSCATPPRTVQATLQRQEKFDDWLGTMEGKEPEDPTRFSLILPKADKPGVAKLPYGWFTLTEAKQEGDALTLTIRADRQLPPTADDIKIIDRAIGLLSSTAVWNKQDDRTCQPNPTKWSTFCALMQATTEVSGGVHYRQPAMQAVREVLNDVGGNRVGKHRLMDYNNHPDTTLAEVHTLLTLSKTRLEKRLR
jgi:hypothetical protein